MSTGSDIPTLQQLDAHVRPLIADVWYPLGLQLLDTEHEPQLNTIRVNHLYNASAACTEMFSLWVQKNLSASWNSLILAIKGPPIEKHDVAYKIEQMLQPPPPAGNGYICRLQPLSCTSNPMSHIISVTITVHKKLAVLTHIYDECM